MSAIPPTDPKSTPPPLPASSSRTLLVADPLFLEHRTGEHPESPQRLTAILGQLESSGLAARTRRLAPVAASLETLLRVHPTDYLERLAAWESAGGGQVEEDTVMSSRSAFVARSAAGSLCAIVDRVLDGDADNGFAAVRPPGHHALADRPMGFCLLGTIAIAAEHARSRGVDRVLIVDFDVHHGNGTQDLFYDREEIGFLSLHRFPFYPGTGAATETGTGRGLGTTVNLPMTFGTPTDTILPRFADAVERLAERLRPDLLLVSAGFDAHRLDPVGNLGFEVEDFGTITRILTDTAARWCGGRLVSVLEGGYHPRWLAESVGIHLQGLIEATGERSA